MSTKICVQSETKNVVVKVCNVITKVNEAKTFIKHFHVTVNAISIIQHVLQIKNRIMININASGKSNVHAKKL